MTATAGQVAVKMSLDKKAFEQGMQEAHKSVNILSTALGALAGLKIGDMLINAGKSAIKASSEFEQANVSFEVMLGSAEKAKNLVKELESMANVTPFETSDLLESSKVLLNFGIELKNIIPDLQMLGDISGGNKDKMRSLTLAFAQMSSAGRLMGQDLLQMINAGFNPLQQISEKTGESMASLKKKMEDGKISVEMVQQAFKDATSEGGKFYGMMDKQSQTLEGTLSTMSDAYTIMTRSISDAALPAIKEQVLQLTKVIEKTTEHINGMKEWASANQQTVITLQNTALAIAALSVAIPVTNNAVTALVTSYNNLGVVTASTSAYQLAFANLLKGEATLAMIQYKAAVQATIIQVKALTVAMLKNPLTWVTVALGMGAAAFFNYKNKIEQAKAALDSLKTSQQESVSETEKYISTLQELSGVQNLDLEQKTRMDNTIKGLTAKYPQYAAQIQNEIALQGKLSDTLARKIALMEMEAQLKKIDAEITKNEKMTKGFHPVSNLKYSLSFGQIDEYKLANENLDKLYSERLKTIENFNSTVTSLTKKAPDPFTGVKKSGSASSDSKKSTKDAKTAAKEATDYKVALLEVEKFATQKTNDEIYQLELKQAEIRLAATKKGTSEYANALAAKLRLVQEYEQNKKQLELQENVDNIAFEKQKIDNQIAYLEIAYNANKINKKQLLNAEIQYIEEKKKLEEQALAEELKLVEGNIAEQVKLKRQAYQTMEQYNQERARKEVELNNYSTESYKNFFSNVASGWGSTVSNLITGQATFNSVFNSMVNSVINSFGNMCGQMVTRWLTDHMAMQGITQAFTTVKVWCDNLLGLSTKKRIAENALLATSEATTATTTATASATTTGAMAAMGAGITALTAPLTKFTMQMAALALSCGAVALTMPIIAISTAITAASAALAAISLAFMNTTMLLTSTTAMIFAPISIMLAAEMAIVTAAANMAAVAVGNLAVALAASTAAAIPFIGWAIAPGAAIATGAGIAAGQMLARSALQFREKGGPVKKGQPYVVGEKRPELFIPDRNGRIEPNTNSLNSNNEGSQNNYNTTVVIQAIDTKDFKQRVGELTDYIHGNIQRGVKKRQLAPLGA